MRMARWLAISDAVAVRPRQGLVAAGGSLLAGLILCATGCQSTPDPVGPVGGAVVGALDVHCQDSGAPRVQPVNASSCHPTFDMAGGGQADMGASTGSEYGETLYNDEGNDDECKYRVKFTTTPVRKGSAVTFTATVTSLATNQPVTGAMTAPEVFLSETHPAPNSGADTTESPPGTYVIGPVMFDAAGKWTMRFHFFEDCTDAVEDSPHGHVAFYVNVP